MKRVVRVIPCLDVDAGRVVKGVNFVGLRDAGDPVELAARYDQEGADELIFLDITASSDARDTMMEVVRRTAEEVFIPFTVGGGIRSIDDARRILRSGADKVSVNTAGSSGASAPWWLSMRVGVASQAVVLRCSPTGDVRQPVSTWSSGQPPWWEGVPARSFLPRWTVTVPVKGSTSRCSGPSMRWSRYRSLLVGE